MAWFEAVCMLAVDTRESLVKLYKDPAISIFDPALIVGEVVPDGFPLKEIAE